MGSGNSKQEHKASVKSDALQDKLEKQKNEVNADQLAVRNSVKDHEQSSKKRCRSVVNLGAEVPNSDYNTDHQN